MPANVLVEEKARVMGKKSSAECPRTLNSMLPSLLAASATGTRQWRTDARALWSYAPSQLATVGAPQPAGSGMASTTFSSDRRVSTSS